MIKSTTIFKSARLKLTALYLMIIMLITVAFSVGVYSILSREVERFARAQRNRLETRLPAGFIIPRPALDYDQLGRLPMVADPDLVDDAKRRILTTLIFVDTAILVCAGLLGYLLAGQTLAPIKNMVDEQNRFISDASHEFKTPLTALKSSFEVFLRDKNAGLKEAKELIKDGVKDVDNLTVLATSLLELAQVEKRNRPTGFKTVKLDEVVGKAVATIKPLAQRNQIKINYQGVSLQILGNKERLIQLFTILLDNAVKYSNENGVVAVSTHQEDGQAIVEVLDTGIGISAVDLPHIFERFYRADASRSKNSVVGYGLGLAIAKSIVEEHKGLITATSEVGKGTVFKVTFRIDR